MINRPVWREPHNICPFYPHYHHHHHHHPAVCLVATVGGVGNGRRLGAADMHSQTTTTKYHSRQRGDRRRPTSWPDRMASACYNSTSITPVVIRQPRDRIMAICCPSRCFSASSYAHALCAARFLQALPRRLDCSLRFPSSSPPSLSHSHSYMVYTRTNMTCRTMLILLLLQIALLLRLDSDPCHLTSCGIALHQPAHTRLPIFSRAPAHVPSHQILQGEYL